MIGLSLSFCVKDIIEGKVQWGDVDCIVSGTNIGGAPEMEQVIESYQRSYWYANPELAATVAWRLYRTHRIHQPRLTNRKAPQISVGHWIPLTADEAVRLNGLSVFRTAVLLSMAEERIAANALAAVHWMRELHERDGDDDANVQDRCNW